jgi:indolepyruvate decarboxylase
MSKTVINHVLARLHDIGIDHIFAVAGDFAFPIHDAMVLDPNIEYVGSCNELNAGYSADGYARVRGVAAVSTTYGVGELSAISAVGGAYASHLPVFHLTGMPGLPAQRARRTVHHTLGNGEYELFRQMAEPVVCASAIMTPQNVASETERLIAAALYHRRPVYMAFPTDVAVQPVLTEAAPLAPPTSDTHSLAAAVDAIIETIDRASTACILPGIIAARAGFRTELQAFVDTSGLPFATMFGDKSVLEERQPAYVGMYDGRLMDEAVREFVESSDVVIAICAMMTDFNSGAFTANLDPDRTIEIRLHDVELAGQVFPNVEPGELLPALTARIDKRGKTGHPQPGSLGEITGEGDDPIGAEALYSRWGAFLRPDDILVAETGTSSMGLAFDLLPKGVEFHNQTLWGAIGWATPAAFGAAVAAPDRRVVLVTGEGSHQLTAQEISQFGRRDLKPVVFVLNNSGYLIERLLTKDPDIAYNDVAYWRYSELPHALGCDGWLTARVRTCGEFDDALARLRAKDSPAYIEVITDKYVASPLAQAYHENIATLYS